MRKSIFAMLIFSGLGASMFVSCSGEAAEGNNTEVENKEYYCPMKCEGDKMYAKEETCPVCYMDLVK